ncbi:dolichyl-P-Man:Man(7)GlcNAc(2)-PP-dolichol alpha-1,6-mannosyltransferase [Spizellomyces punctatus DAOM BR117]|uniref:Uncharacterized protein n=1 Tax=Spizellomyces punctatus (strain DAOM BR117) TaxID=645134 RepID=A0A0L0HQY2_SPIPD|nr:dolichyl-P-Man:Man(7)GlcNAc(2)-PP-dolichol alpha-1,6-mannosyltransferase [Spizellomyces punctatus DAOM BR117]KND03350.1 hypothetical protein SPPG_09019 [Spizellomyces punctatus DAOM BR117]|eukprot:XP_016611389.1 hypothetical protein SPPG_09019 [Spizellomyces punctatus DAOM BR117]
MPKVYKRGPAPSFLFPLYPSSTLKASAQLSSRLGPIMRMQMWCRGPRPPDSNSDQNQQQPIGSVNKTAIMLPHLLSLVVSKPSLLKILRLASLPDDINSLAKTLASMSIKSSGSRPSRNGCGVQLVSFSEPVYAGSFPGVIAYPIRTSRTTNNLNAANDQSHHPNDMPYTKQDALYDLTTLTCLTTHLLLAPYTKVEESFHMHATHDISSGIPLSEYDHFKFPGVVPREFYGRIGVEFVFMAITCKWPDATNLLEMDF